MLDTPPNHYRPDVDALAERLGRGLGDAGHALARERFGLEGFAERFEEVYRSIAAPPPPEATA